MLNIRGMIQNNVDFSHKNDTFHHSIIKLKLAQIGMCMPSVCQNSVEINKIALVIFKFISVHVRRPGARNDVKCR